MKKVTKERAISVKVMFVLTLFIFSCQQTPRDEDILPEVPPGAEAMTIQGRPLYAGEPSMPLKERMRLAKEEWERDKDDADNLIWYGRRVAYTGAYREAIRIFSKGIDLFPDDARMLRHRGHRYITIREFPRAVADFEMAAAMVEGEEDEVEPDGMPNPLNIPVSTLHSNIYYHLGLARYLLGDREGALEAWDTDMALAVNDDMKVATMHWIYMALRELGRNEEARQRIDAITDDMNIIESHAYHKLCLFYKGEITEYDLTDGDFSDIMNDAILYGIGNWHLYHNGDAGRAMEYFDRILQGPSWASFGFIAAEVRLESI